ncbi:MAG: GTPase ObgE [Phototrophicales bacterium]|nr:MAG: GTPase ObgE [Phototrophicales bacterium]RMG75755.1 MAG: GTPase ObgE [Chloroflexota bacterium]
MAAFDEAKIYVRSGDGGDGLITFRREKYVPRGGPSGGDGGHGGDVILRVNPKMSTLSYFHKKVHFKAGHGARGGSSHKTGASAEPLYIDVPPGTVVRDAETGALLVDLVKPYEEYVVLRGGRGGRGNARFASAANQAPRIAEKGEPGTEMWLKLELKLIADVGIVGVPNAGKSTLLSVISNAKPKIANYPFTTLEPNLGVVVYDDQDIVFADIPGLIEGAHMGVGLGHSFLRHVQRTRVLVHMLDGSSPDVLADYSQINTELALYDERLREKPQIVVFNKIDLPQAQAQWELVRDRLKQEGINAIAISAATRQNTLQVIQKVVEALSHLPPVQPQTVDELPLYELEEDDVIFEIIREGEGEYRVVGKRIERAAAMTYWDYEDAVMRFQRILETLGISQALEEAGIQVGDTVYIGDYELEWSE